MANGYGIDLGSLRTVICSGKSIVLDEHSAISYQTYTDELIDEIKSCNGEKTETVYIGGGTPTSIGDELLRIVDAVRENFVLAENYEFTVEANHFTLDAIKAIGDADGDSIMIR